MTTLTSINTALIETSVLNFRHSSIQEYLEKTLPAERNSKADAIALYYAVRDDINYQVFNTSINANSLCGSSVLSSGKGFCLHKAILFATLCRGANIPCRIVAARVRNHISSPALHQLVGGEVFLHWFNEVSIDGRWLKVAPIFNKLLCRIFNIPPLEFDGTKDAFVQGSTEQSEMEYLDEPRFFDTPIAAQLVEHVQVNHPLMIQANGHIPSEREFMASLTKTHSPSRLSQVQ